MISLKFARLDIIHAAQKNDLQSHIENFGSNMYAVNQLEVQVQHELKFDRATLTIVFTR